MIPRRVLLLAWVGVAVAACSGGGEPSSTADASAPAPAVEQPRKPMVFIDAGHGGDETGGVGVSGAVEKDLVLSVAGHLRDALLATELVDVQLSRDEDVAVELVRRPRMANAAAADLFVSLHMNWSESARARGLETYYLDTATDEAAERLAWRENLNVEDMPTDLEAILADLHLAGNVEQSRALALRVHAELLDQLDGLYGEGESHDRGVRTALFAVLVRARMPAVLVELCFLSHPDDERRARTRAFQVEVAAAIAEGLIGFLRDQGTLPPPDPMGEGTSP
jgi:N-acetylmuramoyl-L-alanine amidase